jgi:transposase
MRLYRSFFDVPDPLWQRVELLLRREPATRKGEMPRVPDRAVLAGILYRVRTGCQGNAQPSDFGSGSTCHLRGQPWGHAQVFANMNRELIRFCERRRGIQWNLAPLDSAMVKGPNSGGGATRSRTRLIAGNLA